MKHRFIIGVISTLFLVVFLSGCVTVPKTGFAAEDGEMCEGMEEVTVSVMPDDIKRSDMIDNPWVYSDVYHITSQIFDKRPEEMDTNNPDEPEKMEFMVAASALDNAKKYPSLAESVGDTLVWMGGGDPDTDYGTYGDDYQHVEDNLLNGVDGRMSLEDECEAEAVSQYAPFARACAYLDLSCDDVKCAFDEEEDLPDPIDCATTCYYRFSLKEPLEYGESFPEDIDREKSYWNVFIECVAIYKQDFSCACSDPKTITPSGTSQPPPVTADGDEVPKGPEPPILADDSGIVEDSVSDEPLK